MEFNDVRLQYEQLSADIDAGVSQVLASGKYILGPVGRAFEEEFARYCQVSSGVGVGSGTDALMIGLAALGIRRGDEVLVPAVSAPATAMAVAQIGAVPIFVDVAESHFTMDPKGVLERRTSKCRVVMPVHLYGMPAPLKEIGKAGLSILEDACQAHGSEGPWGRCGSFGVASAFSFYPTKNLGTYGDGGMLVTSDSAIAERAKLLRNYGQRENYASEVLGENSRLDEVHAAILRVKLRKLDGWNRRRREIAAVYREALSELPVGLQAETGKSNYHLFVLTTPKRDELRRHLTGLDIPSLVHYPIPLPRQKAFAEFNPTQCPNADRLCARVLSLPIHAALADHEVQRVIDGVKGFFKKR